MTTMAKKTSKKEQRYVSVLTVLASTVDALVDMMRYDGCFPYLEDDVRRIQAMAHDEIMPGDPTGRVVRLTRVSASGESATEARWRSFGCVVLDERRPDVDQLTQAEIAARVAARTVQ